MNKKKKTVNKKHKKTKDRLKVLKDLSLKKLKKKPINKEPTKVAIEVQENNDTIVPEQEKEKSKKVPTKKKAPAKKKAPTKKKAPAKK